MFKNLILKAPTLGTLMHFAGQPVPPHSSLISVAGKEPGTHSGIRVAD